TVSHLLRLCLCLSPLCAGGDAESCHVTAVRLSIAYTSLQLTSTLTACYTCWQEEIAFFECSALQFAEPLRPKGGIAMTHATASADDRPVSYRIERVAERTGLTRRTLRYYEEIGLLPPPRRTEGNYRLYSAEEVAYIERIHRMKSALGLSLKEVQEFLAEDDERRVLQTTYQTESDSTQRLTALERAISLTRRQLDLITRKIAALEQYSARLNERLQRYEAQRAVLGKQ